MNKASLFDKPVNSQEHAHLRNTAWMGGGLIEGPYLLGMIESENLFKVSREEFANRLHDFIASRISQFVANTFARLPDCGHLIPYLRRIYHTKTGYPPMPSRNDRLETSIEIILNNLEATNDEIAIAVGTTEMQIQRMPELEAIRNIAKQVRDAP